MPKLYCPSPTSYGLYRRYNIDIGVGVDFMPTRMVLPASLMATIAYCFTVHPDFIGSGIMIAYCDTTIDSSGLAVDHSCSSCDCDDISVADSTNTIRNTGIPTWMELTTMSTVHCALCVMHLSCHPIFGFSHHSTIYWNCVAFSALLQ